MRRILRNAIQDIQDIQERLEKIEGPGVSMRSVLKELLPRLGWRGAHSLREGRLVPFSSCCLDSPDIAERVLQLERRLRQLECNHEYAPAVATCKKCGATLKQGITGLSFTLTPPPVEHVEKPKATPTPPVASREEGKKR